MLEIKLSQKSLEFGGELDAAVHWSSDKPVRKITVALGYTVTAKDKEEFYTTGLKEFEHLPREGRELFSLPVPNGPYGCDGITLKIDWQLEVTMKPGKEIIYVPLTISGGNVKLEAVLPPDIDYPKRLRDLIKAPKK